MHTDCFKKIGKTIPIFTKDKKVKLFSVCSGTEAPFVALSMLTGGCVNHLVSCDVNADCRSLLQANSKPQRLYNDVADFLKPKAFCYTCQAQCSTFAEEEPDFYVGGFPCQPYSNLNPKRWTSEYQPFKTPEAKVFLDISKYLRHSIKKPRVVILENVYGLLLRNKSGCAPIDFIMDGVLRDGRLKYEYGLNLLPHYIVLTPIVLSSDMFGLPMVRRRVFLVLIRKDCCTPTISNNIAVNIDFIKSHRLRAVGIAECLSDSEGDLPVARPSKRARVATEMCKKSGTISKSFRRKHKLPAFDRERLEGLADEYDFLIREMDVLDAALLYNQKLYGNEACRELIVDVSQSLHRAPWRHCGKLPSLHKGSKLWYSGTRRVLGIRTCFRAMGWPAGKVVVPETLSGSAAKSLLGNMIAVPVIGAVFLACLLEIF